ncbi:hypothetical protein ACFCZV_24695 [Streptomyces hydrogenans]
MTGTTANQPPFTLRAAPWNRPLRMERSGRTGEENTGLVGD